MNEASDEKHSNSTNYVTGFLKRTNHMEVKTLPEQDDERPDVIFILLDKSLKVCKKTAYPRFSFV